MSVPNECIVPLPSPPPVDTPPRDPTGYPARKRFQIPNPTRALLQAYVLPYIARRGAFASGVLLFIRRSGNDKGLADDLSMKLEEFIDTFVVKGAKATDVYDAIQNELGRLRVAYDHDPDPAEDQSDDVIEEPSNDWPASQA